jgi:hypothetical protein
MELLSDDAPASEVEADDASSDSSDDSLIYSGLLPRGCPDPIFMLALCQLLERQEAAHVRSTHWFDTVVPSMSADRFRRAFRVSREVAQLVLNTLKTMPAFAEDKYNAGRSTPLNKQVLMTLYMMGRDVAVHQVAELFGVSVGLVSKVSRRVVAAIVDGLGRQVTGLWPSTPEKRAAAAAKMGERQGFKECIGAIGGTVVRITPCRGMDPAVWWCQRRQYSGFVAQVSGAAGR